jgi:hypothetical protein
MFLNIPLARTAVNVAFYGNIILRISLARFSVVKFGIT